MKERTPGSKDSSFASMFEQSLVKTERLRQGQLVEAAIVSISNDAIFLELGGKSEGVLARAELADEDGNLSVSVGDVVKAYFMEAKDGEMRFTTRLSGEKSGPTALESAFRNRIPVEGVVEKEIKGGFEIRFGTARAFCPYSQVGTRAPEESIIGRKLAFRIQEYKEGGRSILVSRRAIEDDERREKVEGLKKTLKEGDTVVGKVVRIQEFGAFVELGGIQGLIPVSELARERVANPEEIVSVGQEVRANVLKLDWNSGRITLSLKALLADPWTEAASRYAPDSRHTGTVARVADFGVFVSLEKGLDGLVHASELGGGRNFDARKAAKPGDRMDVRVIAVDVANRRISLKPAQSAEEEETASRYMDSGADDEGYNPFAALLKKR